MDRANNRLEYLKGVSAALRLLGFASRHDLDSQEALERLSYADFDLHGEDFEHEEYGEGCWQVVLTFDCDTELWHATILFNKKDGDHDDPIWESPKCSNMALVWASVVETHPDKCKVRATPYVGMGERVALQVTKQVSFGVRLTLPEGLSLVDVVWEECRADADSITLKFVNGTWATYSYAVDSLQAMISFDWAVSATTPEQQSRPATDFAIALLETQTQQL